MAGVDEARLYTQCPSCATIFVVTLEQLQMAEGEARCGLCSEVFSAVDTLAHELPPRPDTFAEAAEAPPASPPSKPTTSPPKASGEGAARAAVDWMERVLGLEGEAGEPVAPGRRRWLQAVAALLLALLALGQYVHFNSVQLAAAPAWRPYVAVLCGVTGCQVPPRRAPGQIAIAQRTVRSHPDVDGALLVEAVLVNRAEFPQPLPQVQLTLRALNGQPTGRRWFVPEQYLAPGQPALAGSEALLPPGGAARLRLEVREPGAPTHGFEFAFR